MKLYGSLNNRLMEGPTSVVPVVGMPVTLTGYSDRYPGVVTKIIAKNKIEVSEIGPIKWEPWPSGYGTVEVANAILSGRAQVATYGKKKGWTIGSTGVSLGHADAYRDPSF